MADVVPTNFADFHINLSKPPQEALRASATNNNKAGKQGIVQNDILLARLFFYLEDENGESLTNVEYESGSAFGIGASAKRPVGTGLFDAGDFDKVTDAEGVHYDGIVDLRGSAGITSVLGTVNLAACIFNIQVADASAGAASKRRTVAVFEGEVLRDNFNDGGAGIDPEGEEWLTVDSLDAVCKYTSQSVTATTTATLSQSLAVRLWTHRITAGAGAGAYFVDVELPVLNAVAGMRREIVIAMPASANPTLRIYNNTTAGTLLKTIAGDGSAFTNTVILVFNGTAWEHVATV